MMVLFQTQETGISVSIYLIKPKSLLSSKCGTKTNTKSKTKQVQKKTKSKQNKAGLLNKTKTKKVKLPR